MTEKRQNYAYILRRRRLAEQLIKMEIWTMITDKLAERQREIGDEAHWDFRRSSDAQAMLSAACSGRNAEIQNIVLILKHWLAEGEEAEKKLKELGITL